MAKRISTEAAEQQSAQELILHAMAEFNVLSKELVDSRFTFSDMLANMLDDLDN
jgi:hypothetical protein